MLRRKDDTHLCESHLELPQLCDGRADMAALISLQLRLSLLAQDNNGAFFALCSEHASG